MADRIKAVFLAALDTPIDHRLSYLEHACGGDAEVRRRVEALLRAHEEADSLLDSPAWQPTPEQDPPPTLPTAAGPIAVNQPERAGRVHLQGEIARGGMGVVLRGHDPELGRELAVKVMLPAHRGNSNLLRRFVSEARLAGQLQHPGIVPIHDVGQLADGRPFFTMKLIQGRTLAELLAERPDPVHELPRFLRYFEAVCQAVGYAHSRGVIHRDLKPLNVMVGAFGEVQVMDWGLAKRLEDDSAQSTPPTGSPSSTPLPAALTEAGAVVGTPGYLAPEQARGRPGDQRTDVFGLGAILCEILTGKPPFQGAALCSLLQQTREGDLGNATERLEHCGADDELVRLAKDCLAAEPADRPADGSAVAARLAEYLAGMQDRLRRAELGQARAEVRAEGERTRRRLAVGLAVAVLAVVALGGGTLLLVQHQQAEQAREQGRRQEAAQLALGRADDLRKQGRVDEALGVLEQAQKRLVDGDGQIGDAVRQALDELNLVRRLEQIRLRSGTWTGRSFALDRADREYEAEFRAAGLGGPNEPAEVVAQRVLASPVRDALVAALDAWTTCLGRSPRQDWVRAVARGADQENKWARRLRASWNDPAALDKLAHEAPIDRLSPHLLVALAHALRSPHERVTLLHRAHQQYPGDFWIAFTLANSLRALERNAEAVEFYRASLAARPGTVAVLIDLGIVLSAQKKHEEACDCYRRAIGIDPGSAYAYTGLGTVLRNLNRLDEAITCWRRAIELDPGIATAHGNLGVGLYEKGKVEEAIACYHKAIALDPKDPRPLYNLGNALRNKGQLDDAIACYQKAIALKPRDSRIHNNLGIALRGKGKMDEAIAAIRQALVLDPTLPEAHDNLGTALLARSQLNEALPHLRKAVELRPTDAEFHYDLGIAWWSAKEYDRAAGCFRKACTLDPGHARAHCNLGHALAILGDFAEALRWYRRGHELGSKQRGWTYDSATWVSNCEKLIELEKKKLDVLEGSAEPSSLLERLDAVKWCVQTRRYVAAVRLAREAFRSDDKLANDPGTGHRYLAATAAVLAGLGQGRDAGPLTIEARAALRRQALVWLKADLAAWRRHGEESQRTRALRNWWTNKALAGVRDEGLATLPWAERAAWAGFWAEVEVALKPAR
jgi:serine/threonine-protein kinase